VQVLEHELIRLWSCGRCDQSWLWDSAKRVW